MRLIERTSVYSLRSWVLEVVDLFADVASVQEKMCAVHRLALT